MRLFFTTTLITAIGLLAFPQFSAATTPQEPEAEFLEEEYVGDERDELEQELAAARQQMQLSHLRMAAMLTDHNYSMLSAEAEVAIARAALQAFVEYDAALETQTMALEVETTRDRLSDAEEELAQLTTMYERNALADATAQVVLERSARSIERQRAELAIVQKRFEAWKAFGQSYQQQELGHAATLAQASLEATIANQELELAEREAETAELQGSILELEAELASLDSATESDR
ncbi:MAG: hypothetical protein QF489_03140 [Planctomycetota bacterium]|jgi:hypothetical protein|nr:hypothetical protein [Planctomycetota bacterium]